VFKVILNIKDVVKGGFWDFVNDIRCTHFDTVINIIVEHLLAGNKVNLKELGILTVKTMPERKTRNPKTGECGVKPPYKRLTMRATQVFKNRLN